MDSITQAVLGGCIQGSITAKAQGRRAYFYGALLGTLPDLDVFIAYTNPIDAMTHHRGFTHSLFFLTALTLVIVFLIKRFKPVPNLSNMRLFFAIWLALITHPLLDAFTNYGTQLFWPLGTTPISWASIFIVDFAFTVPLVTACIVGLSQSRPHLGQKLSLLALGWGCVYLGLGQYSQHKGIEKVQQAMQQEGIKVARIKASATPFNIILWQVLIEDESGKRYEAISHVLDSRLAEYRSLPASIDTRSIRNKDITRLNWFSDNWTALRKEQQTLVLQDLRMSNAGQSFFSFKIGRVASHNSTELEFFTPIRLRPEPRHEISELISMLWLRLTQSEPMAYATWTAVK